MKYLDSDGVLYFWQKIKTYIASAISNKVDKVTGKGLSTNDYTTAEKTKLTGIADGAEVNVQSDWNQATTTADDFIKNKPTSMPASDVSSWAKAASKPTYTKSEVGLGNVDNVKQYSASNPPPYPVTSVNSKTGAVTLAASDVGALPDSTVVPAKNVFHAQVIMDRWTTNSNGEYVANITCEGFTLTDGNILNVYWGLPFGIDSRVASYVNVNGLGDVEVRSNNLQFITIDRGQQTSLIYRFERFSMVETSYANEAGHLTNTLSVREGGTGRSDLISGAYMVGNGTGMITLKTPAQVLADIAAAPLASPALTGTPTAPTAAAGTNTTQIATTAFTASAIASALADITGISYQVVASLPATGQAGVIYLLSNSGTAPNIYDEYIWTGSAFEKIGTTDVDLSNYVQTTDLVSVTNAEIDTIVAS